MYSTYPILILKSRWTVQYYNLYLSVQYIPNSDTNILVVPYNIIILCILVYSTAQIYL